ncbi:MAG: Acg family FMN-binding oxidoreductase [Pikeienuella sp.]|uniref:Acg family FMN-binding oxidoreductase n=1 Tax=Pikeienuella sp. TaxID=2831957 RepID=UPI00391A985B
MSTRRTFLRLLGGGVVLAAGSAGAFLATRTPSRALAPWDAAGEYEEPRMRALSFAILAPNPHNRQPWEADLREPGKITIWRDKSRDLPETDPYDRQLTIGMGCFLELLAIAAGETGDAVSFELFPEGEEGPVAVASFAEGGARDPLFAHVMDRRSCKEPFEDRAVPAEAAAALAPLAEIVTEAERVAALRALTWEAFQVEVMTPRTFKESVDLMRMGKAEIEANPDGIDLGGPFFESLQLVGMMSREGQMDQTSQEFAIGFSIYEEMLAATQAYAVVTTPGNSRADQIAAGRRWLRLNLAATGLGLALQPVSQALQEFPEMAPHYEAAHALLAKPGETVQMLGRLGYGPETPRTPRWPLETRLRDA